MRPDYKDLEDSSYTPDIASLMRWLGKNAIAGVDEWLFLTPKASRAAADASFSLYNCDSHYEF